MKVVRFFAEVYLIVIFRLLKVFAKGSIEDQYIGCYYDASNQSVLQRTPFDNGDLLTIERCIIQCRRLNATFAGMQNSEACLCGDDFGVSVPDTSCNALCPDNQLQYCGGSNGHTAFYSLYAVCPIGFYGVGCNQTCHCKQQTPCYRVNGICPNGCEDSWMLANCSKETLQSVSDRSIGCYRDAPNRAMEFDYGAITSICTIELCSSICASRNYTYAGLQFYRYCFCGENYDKHGQLNDSSCNSRCDGDASEFCGGAWALSVYASCPVGYFGNGCISRCNCKNREICTCGNCTCSSGCKSGWMGSRCEFRNCLDNNGDCSVNETCVTVDLKFSTLTRCNCKQGYERKRLWETCTVMNECEKNNCDRTTNCIKTVDGFVCVCLIGFTRLNTTHCEDKPCNASKVFEQQGFPLGVVVGASIGSAVASVVIAVSVVSLVICCRRRGQQSKKSEDAAENRRKEVTDAKVENPISLFAYETLHKRPKDDESPYTELTGNENRPEANETRKRLETGLREQPPANEFDRDASKIYEDLG